MLITWNPFIQEICLFTPFIIYSVIYLYQYEWTHTRIFILYFGLQSTILLFCCSKCSVFGNWKLIQLVSVSDIFPSLWDFFFFFFNTSLFSSTIKHLRIFLYISCASPRISCFSRECWFLLLEDGIRNQNLSIRCAHCYQDIFVSGLCLRWQSKLIYVCILTHVYKHIYKYFCV